MIAGATPILVHNEGGDDGWDPNWGPKPDWDPGSGDDDGYNTPGNNQAQNKAFNDAIREAEGKIGRTLSPAERRVIHDIITKQGYGYRQIVDETVQIFGGCK